MGSLGSGEILVIAVAALIVFGPKRLPEIARKASQLLTKTREATQSLTSAIDNEFDGVTNPLQSLKSEYDATMKQIKGAATSVGDMAVAMPADKKLPGETVEPNPDDEDATPIDDATASLGDMSVTMPLDDELPGEGEHSTQDEQPTTDAEEQPTAGVAPSDDDEAPEGEREAS
jgi:sec-independent protein translocase protein TatB